MLHNNRIKASKKVISENIWIIEREEGRAIEERKEELVSMKGLLAGAGC